MKGAKLEAVQYRARRFLHYETNPCCHSVVCWNLMYVNYFRWLLGLNIIKKSDKLRSAVLINVKDALDCIHGNGFKQ